MEEAKRKEIETRLRQLIESAGQNPRKELAGNSRMSGNVQVIRRRKGRPDRLIVQKAATR